MISSSWSGSNGVLSRKLVYFFMTSYRKYESHKSYPSEGNVKYAVKLLHFLALILATSVEKTKGKKKIDRVSVCVGVFVDYMRLPFPVLDTTISLIFKFWLFKHFQWCFEVMTHYHPTFLTAKWMTRPIMRWWWFSGKFTEKLKQSIHCGDWVVYLLVLYLQCYWTGHICPLHSHLPKHIQRQLTFKHFYVDKQLTPYTLSLLLVLICLYSFTI